MVFGRFAAAMAPDLAYVFWHWPRPDVPAGAYRRKLASFQSSLRAARPDLVADLLSYRVGSLPWGPGDSPLYEDWYVVRDFSALGSLNEAAVTDGTRRFHDSVAGDSLKGAGGVFRRVLGSIPLREARYATWIEKTVGTPYQSYYEEVKEVVREAESDLWRRQMVLGPSSQFCVHSTEPLDFSENFHPFRAKVRTVVAPAP
ncbi:MAG: hypothetical protein JRM91_03880 [Nitrososphaerota archaeon]|jgi:hypothetical protein|nr:hypothetical protein [Nitrososphaerota archaeon]